MTTKLLTSLLIGALLSATSALADNRIDVNVVNGKQQASFSLGDSKCVLVGDIIKCVPTLVASN